MTVLQETADVARPIDEVFDYVSDFTTTQEWDATAISARKLTPGKIAIGTEFEVVCALPVGSINISYKIQKAIHLICTNIAAILESRKMWYTRSHEQPLYYLTSSNNLQNAGHNLSCGFCCVQPAGEIPYVPTQHPFH